MKITATQGVGRYLLDLEVEVDGKPQGQIVDIQQGRVFPPQFIGSIIARGYWEACEVSPEDQAAMLALVADQQAGRLSVT